ncbi:hypothetical protein EDB89DRAFT_871052 [Lactarius sanguifluus]|nr:hypothetical protein EDB89DRAFT_871052 [Lactarius sanguifluus]
MTDQPALGPDGQLLDASKMKWYNDPDDAQPIEPTPSAASTPGDQRRPVRTTTGGTRLAEAIAAEKLDEFGNPVQSSRRRTTGIRSPNHRASAKRKRTTADNATTVDTDTEDKTFIGPVTSGGSDDGSDSDDVDIGNKEIADMLPSMTVPEVKSRKGHALKPKRKANTTAAPAKKARTCSVRAEQVEDEDSLYSTATRNATISPMSSFPNPTKKAGSTKKSPIYLFYEIVANGADGTPGDDGDVHYRCLHGAHKVCTIKKSMRSNLNTLVNNLRVHVKSMYQLYCVLKDRDGPPTPDEIDIASTKRQLDGNAAAEYLLKLEQSSENIKKAFQDQRARVAGPWDQEKFEQLLTEWIIACDQPFDEVEKPEFIAMMNATHRAASGGPLKIPKREGIKRRVMKMGEETIEGVREMFL